MIRGRSSRVAALAAFALFAAACANPREDARNELRRLRMALEQHHSRFGRYPDTIDAAKPASPANLPHVARKGVGLRLVHAGDDGIQALARQAPWSCSLNVDPRRGERLECVPLTSAAPEPAAGRGGGASPLDSVLHPPAAAASDGARP